MSSHYGNEKPNKCEGRPTLDRKAGGLEQVFTKLMAKGCTILCMFMKGGQYEWMPECEFMLASVKDHMKELEVRGKKNAEHKEKVIKKKGPLTAKDVQQLAGKVGILVRSNSRMQKEVTPLLQRFKSNIKFEWSTNVKQ